MASLAQAIRTFQSGALSRREFFAQVDRIVETDDAARLLQILDEEHSRVMLPPEVYAELQQRIRQAVAYRQGAGGDETRVQTNPADRFPGSHGRRANDGETPQPERLKGVGDTLNGRFVLEECIGFGGMGTVYKALDLRKLEASDRKPYIAIKVLNVQFRGHPKSLITLQREAKKAQTLAHPNIVTVYDFDRDGSMVYLTMEYLAGKPLSQTLREPGFGGMPFNDAMRIVNGIGKALAYAHERGFVHCDLKPANVFVTDSGDVKVIDFGIARVFQKPKEDVEATVFDPGSLGGLTPAYASPEMIEHREPDPRDDIYALGCITYELLTGRHPFDRLSAIQARGAGMRPVRPRNLGHKQWRALRCALAFEREKRTPSVARFVQEMSGKRGAATQVALWASGVVAAALVGIGAHYLWGLRIPTMSIPAALEATAPPTVEPATPPPSEPAASVAPPAPVAEAPPPTVAALVPILSAVPCSALVSAVDGRMVQVNGYVPESYGIDRLKETVQGVPGVNSVKLDVQELNDDKCDVVKTFAPYWIGNRQTGGAATIRTRQAGADFTEGEPLVLNITTPGFDSYVYVDYYVLDGRVYHLVPSQRMRAHQAPPNYAATIGGLGDWAISKPFGTELVALLVTPEPLFSELRPQNESKEDYLRAVQKQLEKIAAKHGAERIAVDFVRITTRPRKPKS